MAAVSGYGVTLRALVILALVMAIVRTADAASFSLEPAADGSYVIKGIGLEQIAALDFTVVYDPATLVKPTLSKGTLIPGDALFYGNTAISGEMRLLVIRNREITGSGTIATIAFTPVDGRAGHIISFTASPISVAAAPLAAESRTVAPPRDRIEPPGEQAQPQVVEDKAADTTGGSTGSSGRSTASTSGAATDPGTIATITRGSTAAAAASGTIPKVSGSGGAAFVGTMTLITTTGDAPAGSREPTAPAPRPIEAVPVPRGERRTDSAPMEAALARETAAAEGKKTGTLRYSGVKERFRAFTGTRTRQQMTALFVPAPGQQISQEPLVVIADGLSTVRLRIQVPDTVKNAPNFIFSKMKTLSFAQDDRGDWVIEALPERNTLEARLTVLYDEMVIDFPLTVAPPITAAADLSDAAFDRFIKNGADINGDGGKNYLDDYLFTAHYLAVRQRPVLSGAAAVPDRRN